MKKNKIIMSILKKEWLYLYVLSSNIVKVVTSRILRWAGHIYRMEKV